MIGKLDVHLKRQDEESAYAGPPLIEHQTPYHVDYTPR